MVNFLTKLSKHTILYVFLTHLFLPQISLSYISDAHAAAPKKPVFQKKIVKTSQKYNAGKLGKANKSKVTGSARKSSTSRQKIIGNQKVKLSKERQKVLDLARQRAQKKDSVSNTKGLPQKVTSTLNHINKTGSAPKGYKGGRVFQNDGRGGGQTLPKTDSRGKPITYKEYDVNPSMKGLSRGAERLIVSNSGKAYYTKDHYKTFIRAE